MSPWRNAFLPARLHALARFANTAKASVIRRLPESRRVATLVAFAGNLEAAALVLDSELRDADLRSAIFKTLEREELEAAVSQVDLLVRPTGGRLLPGTGWQLCACPTLLPSLLRTIQFEGTPAGESVLAAIKYLREVEHGAAKTSDAPTAIVSRGWRRYVEQVKSSI